MIKFGIGAFFGAGLLAGGIAMANAGGEQRGWNGGREASACTVYEHAGNAGERWELGRRDDQLFVGPRWNDRISSIECRPGCALIAFEDANYRGRQQRYEGRTRFLGPQWNDRISAIRIECGRGGWDDDRPGRPGGPGWGGRAACTFYEHTNFSGRSEDVRDGASVPSIGAQWNDRISSVECRPGCVFTGYEHVNGQGRSVEWRSRVGNVGPAWDDRVSGYRVQCR